MEMTREFAEKMVRLANISLEALRNGIIGSGSEYSHEVGYIEGLITAVKEAGFKVTRNYLDDNGMYILG